MSDDTTIAGGDEGDALGQPPVNDPRTGRFSKGHPGAGRRTVDDGKPLNRPAVRDTLIKAMAQAFKDSGLAGVKKAYKDKPHEFLTFLARVVNATESDTVVQRLVVMGFPVQPPVGWVPELVQEADDTNATE